MREYWKKQRGRGKMKIILNSKKGTYQWVRDFREEAEKRFEETTKTQMLIGAMVRNTENYGQNNKRY